MPKKMSRTEANQINGRYLEHFSRVDVKYPGPEFANFLIAEGLIEIVEPPSLLQAAKATLEAIENRGFTEVCRALRDAIAREEDK